MTLSPDISTLQLSLIKEDQGIKTDTRPIYPFTTCTGALTSSNTSLIAYNMKQSQQIKYTCNKCKYKSIYNVYVQVITFG